MEKMICIPVWRYELILKTFDQAMRELEELKKALCRSANFCKGKVTRKHRKTGYAGSITCLPSPVKRGWKNCTWETKKH